MRKPKTPDVFGSAGGRSRTPASAIISAMEVKHPLVEAKSITQPLAAFIADYAMNHVHGWGENRLNAAGTLNAVAGVRVYRFAGNCIMQHLGMSP